MNLLTESSIEWGMSNGGVIAPVETIVPRRMPIAIDLFCGAGGFGLGLHRAGYHVIAAHDFDPVSAITYMVNLAVPGVQIHFENDDRRREFEKHVAKSWGVKVDEDGQVLADRREEISGPGTYAGSGWISHYLDCDCREGAHEGIGFDGEHHEYLEELNDRPSHPYGCEHFFLWDAKTLTGDMILDAIGVERGEVDLVTAGPPCQGFSSAGKRDVMDPRNSLVFEYARLVVEMQPKAMVMENVPQILSMVTPEGPPVVDVFCRILEAGDYGTFERLKRGLDPRPGAKAALKGKIESRGQPEDPNLDLFEEAG